MKNQKFSDISYFIIPISMNFLNASAYFEDYILSLYLKKKTLFLQIIYWK